MVNDVVDIVDIPKMPKMELVAIACKNYNEWNLNCIGLVNEVATKNSDKKFLNRICVNHLRHEMTGYDDYIVATEDRGGYLKVRRDVLKAIAEAYPWLADECTRQGGRHVRIR